MNGRGAGYQDWAELRTHYLQAFGDTPRAETESRIIAAYELHPAQVERALAAAAVDLEAGTIRSGWAIVAKRCETLTSPPSNPSRAGSATREKAIARAEQWMRNAGCHYPSADETILELCDGGLLSAYAQAELHNDGPSTPARLETTGDQQLLQRIRELYDQERPRGLKAEADAEERARKSVAQRAKEPPRTADHAAHARAEAWKTQHQKEKASRSQPSSSASSPSSSAPSPSDSQSESSPTSHANRLEDTPL
jgi:hypothetical protein